MKNVFLTIFATLTAFFAMAQNTANQSTTLYIDITVERQEIVAGPYARYAQKYLGVSAPLADKVLFEVKTAKINDTSELTNTETNAAVTGTTFDLQHMYPAVGFPKLLIDKTSGAAQSLEESARLAANKIFEIRRNRFELVTGMAGENVFGAGLTTALETLDRLEQEYLSLFLGRQTNQLIDTQYRITPRQGITTYTVCRFSPTEGFTTSEEAGNSDNAPILLDLRPLNTVSTAGLNTADKPSAKTRTMRIADDVECRVSMDDNEIATAIIPVAQFGRTVYVVQ